MTAAIPCGAGYYSQTGAQKCNLCQVGYQCTGTTMTGAAYELATNKCDGKNCVIYVNQIYKMTDCAEGHYCPKDSLF